MELTWIYDANGRLRPQADSGLMVCNARVPSSTKGEVASRCAQDFFALNMSILSTGPDGDSVQSYTMVLIDFPYAAHAARITGDAQKAAADQAQRQEDKKKTDRGAPTF